MSDECLEYISKHQNSTLGIQWTDPYEPTLRNALLRKYTPKILARPWSLPKIMKNSAINTFLRAKFDGELLNKIQQEMTLKRKRKKNKHFQLNIACLHYMACRKFKRNITSLWNQPRPPPDSFPEPQEDHPSPTPPCKLSPCPNNPIYGMSSQKTRWLC